MIPGFQTNLAEQYFICEKCGLTIRPKAFYFVTEEELLEDLKHKCND